ncbi:MAG TPA: hypothetical protein VD886_16280, partial [Herpetosiphonaceae bacterium]|nr:hypothetical protein [Herpetosiphonaceae bacterium]
AYAAVTAGYLLLWPAVIVLAQQIAATHPGLARWAGIFVIAGLLGRMFHAGADHLAFQFARAMGATAATAEVAATYGAFHIVKVINPMIMAGWVILAVGAYRAGLLGLGRAGGLALMAGVPLGVLKGTTLFSLLGAGGLGLACVPLGIRLLRRGPRPAVPALIGWVVGIAALGLAFALLGQAG